MAASKAALNALAGGRGDLAACGGLIARCFTSAHYREGRTAFMEKRAPQFMGKQGPPEKRDFDRFPVRPEAAQARRPGRFTPDAGAILQASTSALLLRTLIAATPSPESINQTADGSGTTATLSTIPACTEFDV